MTTETQTKEKGEGLGSKYRNLKGVWSWISLISPTLIIFLVVNKVYQFNFFVGYILPEWNYFYIIFAVLLSLAYLYVPVKPGLKGAWASRLFWVDVFCFFLILGLGLYLAWNAYEVVIMGWERNAPIQGTVISVVLYVLVLEALRRTSGKVLTVFVIVISLYPVFAEQMPGLLEGIGRPFLLTLQFHILSTTSSMGQLMALFVNVVVAFVLFGIAANITGAGKVFLDVALVLFGGMRGGPAKVGVVTSYLFGAISGSSVANVLVIGPITIPAMKKSGFEPHVAAAIQTCASSADSFSPPIMATTAFVMAALLGINYAEVALAAVIPCLLYYLGLYTQIDAYAAKKGLKGLSKEEKVPLAKTLKNGWFLLPVIVVLVYVLFVLRMVAESAFTATAVMLVLAQFRKETRFTRASLARFIIDSGHILVDLLAMFAAVGMVVGAFSVVGVVATFARELLILAQGNALLILIMCAVAGLILGMGMPAIAVYIFLAIVMAPALILVGLDELASHLFILYVGMLSYITPPVALCAFPAAAIARVSPMKVGITACTLGGAIFLVPFFFVAEPGLLLRADAGTIVLATLTAGASIFIIGSALQGYMIGIGKLWATKEGKYTLWSYVLRTVLVGLAVLVAIPGWTTDIIGLGAAAAILLPTYMVARHHRRAKISPPLVV